jgi:hypothetical protein
MTTYLTHDLRNTDVLWAKRLLTLFPQSGLRCGASFISDYITSSGRPLGVTVVRNNVPGENNYEIQIDAARVSHGLEPARDATPEEIAEYKLMSPFRYTKLTEQQFVEIMAHYFRYWLNPVPQQDSSSPLFRFSWPADLCASY